MEKFSGQKSRSVSIIHSTASYISHCMCHVGWIGLHYHYYIICTYILILHFVITIIHCTFYFFNCVKEGTLLREKDRFLGIIV